MGIGREIYDFEQEVLLGRPERLCDLGAQIIRAEVLGKPVPVTEKEDRATEEHVAIDIGGFDGSLELDLSKDLRTQAPELMGRFDVVTNYGTIEHVTDQAMAFVNMDMLTKPGGIMIHAFMIAGHWPNHGLWWYTEDFGFNLAVHEEYQIIDVDFPFRKGQRDKKMGLFAYVKTGRYTTDLTQELLEAFGLQTE